MKIHLNKKIVVSILVALVLKTISNAQITSDSLSYKKAIEMVVLHNPLIKQAEEKSNGSVWKEKLATSAYLPNVSAAASVTKLYPMQEFDFGTMHIQMVPDFSMDYGVKVNQLIYDFGKTNDNQGLTKTNSEINRLNIEQLKQQLAMSATGNFFTLVYIQSAIDIKSDEIKTLKQHLQFVENKQRTGSATQYEILSTKVRISVNETQLTDLQTSLQVQLSHLNKLMDTTNFTFVVKDDLLVDKPMATADSLFNFAFTHRDEALLVEKKASIAEWNYKLAGSQYKPSLMFIGSTGFKNGYLPEVNKLQYNYLAGLSLNIPIFDGNRKHINQQIAGSGIAEVNFEKENIRNTISDEVKENYVSLQLAEQKIKQFTVQLEQANEAYEHAQANFKVGAITNLDLLDASNAIAESKLMLLKAQIDYKLYLIKFKAAIGERLY
jgi:outer membrane protein TolC